MYNGPERKKLRLNGYDYGNNGYYFVTICTKEREYFFGEIINGKMILNEYGKIAERFWKEMLEHYEKIKIDEFVIMPNHIHGIIIIENNVVNEDIYSLQDKGNKTNLSNIIKGFKIGCTKEIRNKYNDFVFGWQKSFYDIIIKNDEQLYKSRNYILNNPLKWELDINNSINIKKSRE